MSLTALKRKTENKYYGISTNRYTNGVFTINPSRRTDTLYKSSPIHTPLTNGGVPKGHGSPCCSNVEYAPKIIKSQYINSGPFISDGTLGRLTSKTVMSYDAYLKKRTGNTRRPQPLSVYKDMPFKSAGDYTSTVANDAIVCNNEQDNTIANCDNKYCSKQKSTLYKKVGTLSQSEYMKTKLLIRAGLPTPDSCKHIPVAMNANCFNTKNVYTDSDFPPYGCITIRPTSTN